MAQNPPDPCRCSFCGKTQQEVKKLVAGPVSFICDECIDLCYEIVHGFPKPEGEKK